MPRELPALATSAPDFTQADHTQRFAHDFRADKFVLAFFHQLGDALFALERLAPGNAAHDVARGQQHARQHQFLHGVGIGTRGVKNHHALLAKGVQGNVVHACARARHALDALRQGELVQICATHQYGVRIFHRGETSYSSAGRISL